VLWDAVVGDARALPLPDASRDVAVVQGGLHHLFTAEERRRPTNGG
jgi:ubiquinone/menaquinone biosynthesis C-methylase UbiE